MAVEEVAGCGVADALCAGECPANIAAGASRPVGACQAARYGDAA